MKVHRLNDPSLALKIVADEYPKLQVIATCSSALAATSKFGHSLTGRKETAPVDLQTRATPHKPPPPAR